MKLNRMVLLIRGCLISRNSRLHDCIALDTHIKASTRRNLCILPFLNPQNGAAGQNKTPVTITAVVTVPPLLSPLVLLLNSSGTFVPSTAITSCIADSTDQMFVIESETRRFDLTTCMPDEVNYAYQS